MATQNLFRSEAVQVSTVPGGCDVPEAEGAEGNPTQEQTSLGNLSAPCAGQ